jgi:hypothetical protein
LHGGRIALGNASGNASGNALKRRKKGHKGPNRTKGHKGTQRGENRPFRSFAGQFQTAPENAKIGTDFFRFFFSRRVARSLQVFANQRFKREQNYFEKSVATYHKSPRFIPKQGGRFP